MKLENTAKAVVGSVFINSPQLISRGFYTTFVYDTYGASGSPGDGLAFVVQANSLNSGDGAGKQID